MIPAISPATVQAAGLASTSTPVSNRPTASFGDAIGQFVGQANQDQLQADQSIKQLVEGKSDDVQQVVMAVAQADMSFQLFMEIRNKLVDTYNELMRMQF